MTAELAKAWLVATAVALVVLDALLILIVRL